MTVSLNDKQGLNECFSNLIARLMSSLLKNKGKGDDQ
jgi:hypothetical protein